MKTHIIKPGAEISLMEPDDITSGLTDHFNQLLGKLGQGVRFRRLSAISDAGAAGAFNILFEVPQGFVWALKWATFVDYTTPAGAAKLFFNDASTPLNGISALANSTPQTFGNSTYVFYSGDSIICANAAAVVAADHVGLQIGFIEVPINHEFQLL